MTTPGCRTALLDDIDRVIVAAHCVNILIEGAAPEVDDVLAELRHHFHHERYQWPAVPRGNARGTATVVARVIADFSPEEFSTLRALLGRPGTQMITISSVKLYERVAAGLFPPDLYDRLNLVRISCLGDD